ncbi:MAG: arginine--tRNA ligase [Gemmatimonadetes bacterium]|nr:arginine--tRNA ligase [Gemmatimonadota bacterium]
MIDVLRQELNRIAGLLGAPEVPFVIERPRDPDHGDLATNLALLVAKARRTNPRKVAEEVVAALALPASLIVRTEIAGPGFINFWLAKDTLALQLTAIVRAGAEYGRSDGGRGIRVNVEFVSANPTGPLHVGHGRGAALGDGIAALLEWSGHTVVREFYINDAGAQIDKLALSLWARVQQAAGRPGEVPEGGYHGEYLGESAVALMAAEAPGFPDRPEAEAVRICRAFALASQRLEQDQLMRDFGVHFDVHTSEQSLYDEGKVAVALRLLEAKGLLFTDGGATWMRTTSFGDDKDRVIQKSDGSFTYLAPDIAYHIDKFARGFDHLIDVWGADHHGYIPRLRAVLVALGHPAESFEVPLVQLVKVVRGGEEVKMSKRAGNFVTLRELLDEVGVDAARYFFLMRRGETPFAFDVDLAKKQTDENPVFYVQMAHARMTGLFRVAERAPESVGEVADLAGLPAPEDTELLKALTAFPEIVARAAAEREPHRITVYLEEIAQMAHGWYHQCRVLGEAPAVEQARLVLARAARQVLGNGLKLLGLRAPDRM